MYRRLCAAMLCVWFLLGMTACGNTGRSAEDTSPPADSSSLQGTDPSGSDPSGVPDVPEAEGGTADKEYRTEPGCFRTAAGSLRSRSNRGTSGI